MNYKSLVIGIIIGGFIIVGASVSIGLNVRDVEVEQNAYEAGLKFDHDRKEDAKLGWNVTMPKTAKTGQDVLPLEVRDHAGKPVSGAVVDLELVSMASSRVDVYRAADAGSGRYAAEVLLDKPGYWDIRIRVHRGGDSFRDAKQIYIQ